MPTGAITGYMDVAQITLYAFWIFLAFLIFYLRSQDRLEGYPLEDESAASAPINAVPMSSAPGSPLIPIGNPLLAGVGPGAWAERSNEPDWTLDDHLPKIVPLRVAGGFYLDARDPDPRGYTVIGGDRRPAGVVADVWVDRNEYLLRFYELEVPTEVGPKRVLVPSVFAKPNSDSRTLSIKAILSSQFADVPTTASPDFITAREEDQIAAYYGAGTLYATAARSEPII